MGSSTRATPGRAPVAYGEKLKCLASGQVLGGNFLWNKTPEARQQPLSHTEPQSGDTIVETPSTWFTQVAPPWRLSKLCPIQFMGALFYIRPLY